MEDSKLRRIIISITLTLILSCGVYMLCTKLYSDDSSLGELKVSASDNIVYDSTTFVMQNTNQKMGLTFEYYYDDETDVHGIKINEDYKYEATEISQYYGQGNVFLVRSEDMSYMYVIAYNDKDDTYKLEELFDVNQVSASMSVNRTYNGLTINTIEKNEGLGWIANCTYEGKKIVKKAIEDNFMYPEYTISDTYCPFKVNAKFSQETHEFEFTIDGASAKNKPLSKWDAETETKLYDVVYIDLKVINSAIIGRYNTSTETWEITKAEDIPLCESEKEVYETDEVSYIPAFDMYVNRIILEDAGKLQCFDKEGNFLSYYVYNFNPQLK